ncbi:hypothetical protein AKJ16_DCAP19914 [Drosera capensis]
MNLGARQSFCSKHDALRSSISRSHEAKICGGEYLHSVYPWLLSPASPSQVETLQIGYQLTIDERSSSSLIARMPFSVLFSTSKSRNLSSIESIVSPETSATLTIQPAPSLINSSKTGFNRLLAPPSLPLPLVLTSTCSFWHSASNLVISFTLSIYCLCSISADLLLYSLSSFLISSSFSNTLHSYFRYVFSFSAVSILPNSISNSASTLPLCLSSSAISVSLHNNAFVKCVFSDAKLVTLLFASFSFPSIFFISFSLSTIAIPTASCILLS